MQLVPQKAADMLAAAPSRILTCVMCRYSPVSGNQANTDETCSTAPVPTVVSTALVIPCRLVCPRSARFHLRWWPSSGSE
eukprot:8091582-Pyramimonas_sp.AAC.1